MTSPGPASPPPSSPPPPARFGRAALERILQRAAELQAAERDIGEGLTPDEIVALGQEVGIPAHLLRQAMLEERARIETAPAGGVLDRILGPGEVGAVRVIRGDPDRIEGALLAHMQRNELFTLLRRQPGWLAWERLQGVQAALRSALSSLDASRARFMLSRADQVRATITALEPGWCQVALTASVRRARSAAASGSVTVAALGGAGTVVLFLLDAIWVVAVGPAVGGALLGWVTSRRFGPQLERVRLGLEQALDYAEGEMIKPAHELPPRSRGWLSVLAGELWGERR